MRKTAVLLFLFSILNSLTAADISPAYYGGAGLPPTDRLTRVSTDVVKDQATNHLDITADYFSFSGTKFYAAIQNRGGGFPTSGGLGTKYFSYMFMLTKPGDADTVWALTYIHVALGGITPGLYKIVGKKASDLIRIGDISYEIRKESNLLVMSCDIASLLADPSFAAWYNPAEPVLATLSVTSKTTVIPFGTTTSDKTPGSRIYPGKLNKSLKGSNPALLEYEYVYGLPAHNKMGFNSVCGIRNYAERTELLNRLMAAEEAFCAK